MLAMPLSQWRTITATSAMPLYAVLSNVSDAQAVKNYYITDGSQTPYGLYTGTPYEHWFSVMPMLVRLDEHSPFLDWINNTEHKDWGWLARSHLPFADICAHLRSLIQAIMPDGETVFFRYWDGEYLSIMLDYFTDSWQDVLPAFAFYWINHQSHVVHVPVEQAVQTSPWWQVPENLLEQLSATQPKLLVNHILQLLQENYLDIYTAFPYQVLETKIIHLLSLSTKKQNVFDFILQQLDKEKKET
ncbi:hypothetical protein A9G29_10795 [Gilliamella sp. Fer2-1]|nr:hypothetical protein A9G29_10795 [Gilliamella apicola]